MYVNILPEYLSPKVRSVLWCRSPAAMSPDAGIQSVSKEAPEEALEEAPVAQAEIIVSHT